MRSVVVAVTTTWSLQTTTTSMLIRAPLSDYSWTTTTPRSRPWSLPSTMMTTLRMCRRDYSTPASSSVSQQIADAYNDRQTDGILALDLHNQHAGDAATHQHSAKDLWDAIVTFTTSSSTSNQSSSSRGKKGGTNNNNNNKDDRRHGIAASIVHALLASAPTAESALDLFELAFVGGGGVDSSGGDLRRAGATSSSSSQQQFQIRPDLVTFCLMADVMSEHDHDRDGTTGGGSRGEYFLDRARRYSDKTIPGSRTERAAARRRPDRSDSFRGAAELKVRARLPSNGDDYAVLYEDERFAVINKPAGISCSVQPANSNNNDNKSKKDKNKKKDHAKRRNMDLPTALLQTIKPLSTINRGLVHRLDQDTSGCMIVPKTDQIHAYFVRQFFLRNIHKTYYCYVEPPPPPPHCAGPAAMDINEDGTIRVPVDDRPAESRYRILHRDHSTGRAALEMSTRTGRKHQVRVHCAYGLHRPIVGDRLYNHQETTAETERADDYSVVAANIDDDDDIHTTGPLLHLHARKVSFRAFGEQIDVETPLPSFWPTW